jgi:NAD(P)-dependent dehydrogenase (short-subunit alcohol dehydrogenase family)
VFHVPDISRAPARIVGRMTEGPLPHRLTGKVAVVTGAASGIGRAITGRFVREGAVVFAGDVDGDGLAALVSELGAGCVGVEADLVTEAGVEALHQRALAEGGRLDIAVANVGRGAFNPIVDQPLEEWQFVLDTSLTASFLAVRAAGRRIADGGSIIAIASLNAVQPAHGMAAYCVAKAGVSMLVEVAAMELGGRGVRVNAIAPGLVDTPATRAGLFELPGVVEEFVDNTTVGRFAQPADVAAVAAFLAADESSFVSAATYLVDGGAATKRYPDLPTAIARATGGSG